jgi:hypothetical protein
VHMRAHTYTYSSRGHTSSSIKSSMESKRGTSLQTTTRHDFALCVPADVICRELPLVATPGGRRKVYGRRIHQQRDTTGKVLDAVAISNLCVEGGRGQPSSACTDEHVKQ